MSRVSTVSDSTWPDLTIVKVGVVAEHQGTTTVITALCTMPLAVAVTTTL
jgi:hypothetical protein